MSAGGFSLPGGVQPQTTERYRQGAFLVAAARSFARESTAVFGAGDDAGHMGRHGQPAEGHGEDGEHNYAGDKLGQRNE